MGFFDKVRNFLPDPVTQGVGKLKDNSGYSSKDLLKGAASYGLGSQGKPYDYYQQPDIDFLRQPAPSVGTDYLKQFKGYGDFYKGPTGFKGYNDFYRAPTEGREAAFQSYIEAINAPSSVDEVRSGMNKEQLDLLIGDIERDTRGKFGQGLIESFGRGLFDPSTGADSDIARVTQGQIAASGGRSAAQARLGYSLADLDRLAAREAEQRQAYGQRYSTESARDTQMRDIASRAAQGDQAAYFQMQEIASRAAQGDQAAYMDLMKLGATGEQTNAQLEAERRAELARLLMQGEATRVGNIRPGDYGGLGKTNDAFNQSFGQSFGGLLGSMGGSR